MPGPELAELAERIRRADKLAVAQALNRIEDRRAESRGQIVELLSALAGAARAHRVGITGPPGVGKSTLTAGLARELRTRGRSVGVVAVDPSSLQSGGALLGDRARMKFDPADLGLFVRSLATAGEVGGLAHAAAAAVEVLAAAYDVVIVETTGVGQTETAVRHVVDSVCLVVQPGSGDVLQFIKAGIMEIPDVLVVNKGDHGSLARRAASDLTGALDTLRGVGMADHGNPWQVPVLVTSARDGTGIDTLCDQLQAHLAAHDAISLASLRRQGARARTAEVFERRYGEHGVDQLGGPAALTARIGQLLDAGLVPVAAAEQLGAEYLEGLRRPTL
jgi:LAO/AO transport system kinase